MKKQYFFLILTGVALIIFTFLIRAFPKNASLLPTLLVLMVLDGYLWFSIKDQINRLTLVLTYTLSGLYWLPLMLVISSMITTLVIPYLSWSIGLRTYLPGIILIIYICKVFPILALGTADIVRYLRYLRSSVSHGESSTLHQFSRNRWISGTGWMIGGIFFVLMILGMTLWNHDFQVKKEKIALSELPASFDGLNIVQISDLHLGSWASKADLTRAVEMVNSLNPDIIFFTGDIANLSTGDVYPFEEILSQMRSKRGIFAILGNHDYGDYISWPSAEAKEKNLVDLFSFYKRIGWKLLLNENYILRNRMDSIAIIGVQNWGSIRRFQRLGDVGRAELGCENFAVQLLLTHDPSNWDYVVKRHFTNIDVTFSGHTHGFQFGIECCGIRWSPAQYLYLEWAGLYSNTIPGQHPQYLYVNRGLGSIGFPGRIGILPEITQIVLVRK